MRAPVPLTRPAAEMPELVEIACNLCGAQDARLICMDQGYRICRCARCSLIYVTPQPVLSGATDVSFHADSEVASDAAFRQEKSAVYAQGVAELNRLQPQRGAVLDIGCGFGLFLDQARDEGWEPYGIDVSDVAVAHARTQLGLSNVHRADLAESQFSPGFFQAATLWNVLEHVPDPFETLTQVRRIVSPNGVVVVRVPNMLVHNALWRARPALRPLLRSMGSQPPPYLGGISPPHHLYGFTPRTLEAMLHRAGYPVVDIQPAVPHGARSTLGMLSAAIGRGTYRASLHRLVLSPAILAYARPSEER